MSDQATKKLRTSAIVVFVLAVLVGALLGAPLTLPEKPEDVTRPEPNLPEAVTKPDASQGVTRVEGVKQEEGRHTESPHKEKDEDKVEGYLKRYGYLNKGVSKNSFSYGDEQKDAIKRLQKFYNLNITGELDEETIKILNASRCALPDFAIGMDGKQKRYVLISRWPTSSLTYRIDNYPSRTYDFSNTYEIDMAINNAFKLWTDSSGLQISKSQGSADIRVAFYAGDHWDGDPFDGRGGILAHAFFPNDGRIHMDDSESWSNSGSGYNLNQVATHEAGHALGLAHTNDPNAVMFPTYRYRTDFQLGTDDVRGIQALYGPNLSPGATRPPTTTTTRRPYWWWYWVWRRW